MRSWRAGRTRGLGGRDLAPRGFDRATVKKVEHLLYLAEYKRFQSAPGVRLTQKAFWLDRRYPIAMRWRDGFTLWGARPGG
jgi:hypothetical protein